MDIKNDISEILFSAEDLRTIVKGIANNISSDYAGKAPLFIGVLKGSFVFMSDLVRELDIPCHIDFLAVSSYANASFSSGAVRILKDTDTDICGKDVILIEDILDSGLTLSYIKGILEKRKPGSLKVCTLLDKPQRRKVQFDADYTGAVVPDKFIVGYGLDYAEKYRNLPYIAALTPSVYENK
jgi:hypoxanthine phosphoribosyltransferase